MNLSDTDLALLRGVSETLWNMLNESYSISVFQKNVMREVQLEQIAADVLAVVKRCEKAEKERDDYLGILNDPDCIIPDYASRALADHSVDANKMVSEGVCEWTYDDDKDYWLTFCGDVFIRGERSRDLNFKFCPYCGRKIKEAGNDETVLARNAGMKGEKEEAK
jgi:hypothetical protein